MTNIERSEVEIVGLWIFDGRTNRADEACRRIERLTDSVLQKLADSRTYGAWGALFRDPGDGRLWERAYPQGDLHGGGPPRLAVISEAEARQKYDF